MELTVDILLTIAAFSILLVYWVTELPHRA